MFKAAAKYFVAAALLGISVPLIAAAYTSPGKPTGFVNDFASVLSLADKTQLEQKLSSFEKTRGHQIAVVIIPSLGGDTVENYAVKLFKEWGIGNAQRDDGALILVAMAEHEMRIEVGYGLEGDLTDAKSSQIIRNILIPAFKSEDYAGGLTAAVDAIIQTLATGELPPTAQDQGVVQGSLLGLLFKGFPFGFFGLLIFLQAVFGSMASTKSWWLGGVFGAIAGGIFTAVAGFLYSGLIAFIILVPFGLFLDWYLSRHYANKPWWTRTGRGGGFWWGGGGGGFGGGSGGGGFGGFGGGSSGGGGASGKW